MNSKEDERVAHCSVEKWEAGRIRVARVVVEIDAFPASLVNIVATHIRATLGHVGWMALLPPRSVLENRMADGSSCPERTNCLIGHTPYKRAE
jgi:hypothetical protein